MTLTHLLKRHSYNIQLLITTAFMGVLKTLTLLQIHFLYAEKTLADFVNDTFIISIISMLTSLNWSVFILTDMSKLPSNKREKFFYKIIFNSLPSLCIGMLLIIVLHQLNLIVYELHSILYLVCWSFYQIWRSYFIAEKKQRNLVIYDLLLLILSFVGLFIGINPLTITSLCFALTIFFSFNTFSIKTALITLREWKMEKIRSSIHKKSFDYFLLNFSTGGIQLFFAPLSYQLASPYITSRIGIVTNVSTIALLVPRTLLYKYLPELVRSYRYQKENIKHVFSVFQRRINLFLFTFLAIGFITIVLCLFLYENKGITVAIILFLVYSNLLISQFSLPSSNYLLINGNQKALLKVNVSTFALFVLLFIPIYAFITSGTLVVLLSIIIQLVLGISRSIVLYKICNLPYSR